jgi:hypothetical protein
MVTICTLHENGSLDERLLPLSTNDAHEFHGSWTGSWFVSESELHILIAGHHLMLRPSLKGTWTGVEYFGYEERPFIGAVVDPTPIPAERPWVALRLMNGSIKRRLLVADIDGSLEETDLYERDKAKQGTWTADRRGVRLEIDGSWLHAERFGQGVLIATDEEREASREFALVHVCIGSDADLPAT